MLFCGRLDRLNALQQAFRNQLGTLEASHTKQETSSRQMLERDMTSLRKRLLADNVSC